MKKFNAILAIATVALTSVFGFTSCQQDDAFDGGVVVCPGVMGGPTTPTDTPTDTPKANGTVDFEFFVSDEVLSLGEYTLTMQESGRETVMNMADGENDSHYYNNNKGFENTFTGKKMVFHNLKPGTVVTPSFKAFDGAFESLPADGVTEFMIMSDVVRHGYVGDLNIGNHTMPGLMNVKLEKCINDFTNKMVLNVK